MSSMRSPTSPASAPDDVIAALDDLREARDRTLRLVEAVSDDDLARVHSPLMSPLVWDLGHIAAFEDLWMSHRYAERRLLRADLVDVYDAMETPRADRGDLRISTHYGNQMCFGLSWWIGQYFSDEAVEAHL